MAKHIYVKGTRDNRRVVLAEAHPDHPEGEIFVVNDGRVVKVAMTSNVAAKIAVGELVEVEAPKGKGAKGAKDEGDTGGQGGSGDSGQQTGA